MLQDMVVIITTDKVKCPVTHKTVYQFDVTGNLPTKHKKATMADKKRDLLATFARIQPWCSEFKTDDIESLKQQINNL